MLLVDMFLLFFLNILLFAHTQYNDGKIHPAFESLNGLGFHWGPLKFV